VTQPQTPPGTPGGYGPPPAYGYAVPPPQYAPPPRPTAPDGRPLADFGDRLLAVLIDTAVLAGVALVLIVPIFIVFIAKINDATNRTVVDANGEIVSSPNFASIFLPILGLYLVALLLTVAFSYVYEVEMMYRRGATWGKRAMKLRIVPLADPTAPLTRGMAAKRWLVSYVLGAVVPFFRWIDGLWQLWDQPYRQCLHDKWADTVVVKVSQ
jgi:uncharacterized RDD family membrane protein YckC